MRSIIEEFNISKNIRNYVIKRTIANTVNDDNKVALGAYGLYKYLKNKKDIKNHENQRSLN